jgi:muramidase (phage lysozyme)
MAEFQEQDLFQGAVQAQGFSPLQAPDTSQFLRENMEQVDRNFANLKSQRQAQLDSSLTEQLRTLEMFGQFSKTAMEAAQVMGQAYIDHQFVEGANKMRSQMGYGVTDEQRAEYEATKAVLKNEEQNNVDPVVNDFVKNNEPLEAINFIKGLPHYQRIAATEYYLKQKGTEYITAREAFFSSTTIQLDGPNGKFTPSQIDDDPVKASIALGAFSRMFLADNVGIGKDFNPSPVMMTALYEEMDKADNAYMQRVRINQAVNQSLDQLRVAEQAYEVDNDIPAMISRAHGAINVKTGKPMTRAEARMHVYELDLNRYRAGDKGAFDKYKNTVVPYDSKGRTYFELYEKEFTGIGGIYDKVRAIDKEELLADDNGRKVELRNIEVETQTFLENASDDDRDDPDFYIRLRQRLRPRYGDIGSDEIVNRLEKTYRPDLLRDEQMLPMLKEKAGNLELTDEFLDQYQVSANMRTEFQNEIAKSNALREKSVKEDEKAVRNAIRNVAKRMPDGTTSPMATLIEADLVSIYQAKRKEYLDQTGDPAKASREASIDTVAFFEAQSKEGGRYYKNPRGQEFDKFKEYLGIQGQAARNITKRYYDLVEKAKKDGSLLPLIKEGKLFDKSQLERLSTVIERDPFLTSIDQKDPLYVPLTQAKALIKNTGSGLSLYKVLKQAYDATDMEVPPVIEQIQPKLDQLSPRQTRFLNNVLNGTVSANQINRNVMPIGRMPLRPGKEYAVGLTGMSGLRALTRSGEGGYTSMFPSESYPQLTNMTIRQVVELQKQKLQDGRQSAAVGAYQILYPEKAAKMAGLSLDDKFTPQNQDMMFDALITQKRPKINDYLTGKSNDIDAALDELAKEFASFEYRGGTTYYNDGVNRASIRRTKAAAALRSAREEMMAGGSN